MPTVTATQAGLLGPALTLLRQGEVKRAFSAYRAVQRQEPRNVGILFNFANALAARGMAKEAEAEYREALGIEPFAPDILNNLASVVGDSGRHEEAADLCDRGLSRDPRYAPLLRTRARERLFLKRTDGAAEDVEALLSVAPAMPDAHNLKGDLRANQGRWPEAIEAFKQALELSGNERQYQINLASAYAASGALAEASTAYMAALKQNNRDFKTLNALAAVLQRQSKNEDAIRACELALRLKPDLAEAQNRIASCYLAMENWGKARETAEAVLARQPDHQEALYNLGLADIGLRRYKEAIACFDAILAAGPNDDMALLNLGNALSGAGRIQDAIDAYTRMIARLPHWAGGYLNRGHAIAKQRRWTDALADYTKAAELEPNKKDHLYSIGNVHLHLGEFEEGWKGYEYRNKSNEGVQKRVPELPVWNGENLKGKRLLVFAEQGLGDNVQMARYLPLLQQRGAELTFHGYPVLRALLETAAPGLNYVDEPKAAEFDFQVATMSLPFKFGTQIDTVPQNVPYFTADPDRVRKWSDRIGRQGFRIGINWQGNPTAKIDEGRSAPLAQFLRFAEVPGVRLISLQKNHGLDQLKQVPDHIKVELLGDDFDSGKDAFLDTLAVLSNLDLVVTTDTSLVHVAGGFGARVFVALKDHPDWRWMFDRDDSPWYPSARLFRQTEFAVWDDVFARMAEAVRELAAEAR